MDKCIRPQYTKDFRCDGSACQSACCKGWRIFVDERSVEKYRNIADENERAFVLAGITDDDKRQKNKLKENGDCYFLQDDGLCRLQRTHGEDFLSDVCHEYPRVTYRLAADFVEQSMTLACPVAARLILLPTDKITFVEEPFEVKRENFVFDMQNKGLPPVDDVVDIQGVGISILQDRRFSMDERLFLLDMFCEKTDEKAKNPHELLNEQALAEFLANAAQELGKKDFSMRDYLSYIMQVFAIVYDMPFDEKRLCAMQKLVNAYGTRFFAAVIYTKRHIWENYAVNKFFMTLCPWTADDAAAYNCRLFMTGFKLTEFAAFVTAVKHQGTIDDEELLKTISYVSEQLDHNKTTGLKLRKFVAQHEKNTLPLRQTLLNTMQYYSEGDK